MSYISHTFKIYLKEGSEFCSSQFFIRARDSFIHSSVQRIFSKCDCTQGIMAGDWERYQDIERVHLQVRDRGQF